MYISVISARYLEPGRELGEMGEDAGGEAQAPSEVEAGQPREAGDTGEQAEVSDTRGGEAEVGQPPVPPGGLHQSLAQGVNGLIIEK